MRLNTSNSSLFALSSLFFLSSSLPFVPRKVAFVEPLVRRATYSVVAVDGGPAAATGAGGSSQGDATIIDTIIQTQAPATKTVIETDFTTLPAVTDHIVATKTIEGSDTTQTVVVTLTPSSSPTNVAGTGYSIIDIDPAPSTTSSSCLLRSSTSITSSQTHLASPPTSPSSSTPTSSSADATRNSSSNSYTSTFTLSTGTSTSTIPSIMSSATKLSYDNGQWHTTYPAWSNSTATRTVVPKFLEASPSASTIMPTLQATTPVAVPADSVPIINAEDIADGALGEREYQT